VGRLEGAAPPAAIELSGVAGASADAGAPTRFDRQIGVAGLGTPEQRRLSASSVLVAGVGRLELVHPGALELPDLNRQTLMTPADLGAPRVLTAADTLRRHFPDVEVVAHDAGIAGDVFPAALARADVVVDARHNFPERYLINRLCRRRGVPSVVAAMDGAALQLMTCEPGGPCWRCVFPREDPGWEPLGFRVLGAVAGTAGCLAAAEVVKLIAGAGSVLRGRLLVADLWEMTFTPVPVRRAPGCSDCGADGS
jgi:molybdopterin/thiamine biosynthesis adenylyltransferase